MTKSLSRLVHVVASSVLIATPIAVSAKSADNLRDLIGARGSSGEMELSRRGFVVTDGHKGAGSSYTYWWNGVKRDCVMVRTANGRYASISDVSAADCNQQSHHGSGAAVAVGVGALLGAALLAHKSGHHDDQQHMSDQAAEAEYERGYRDGLHGQDYHNYNRNDAYAGGYRSGVDQRGRETDYRHSGAAGYSPSVNISDLVGARAAGADSALRSRGFLDVDNFESGRDGAGVIWWNNRTRQCVQVITVDGHIDSAVDIGQHPRCRG